MKTEKLTEYLISPNHIVVEAMRKIDENAKGILFVTDEQRKLAGVVTDGDIRRWLIKTGDLNAPIYSFMNVKPYVICRKETHMAFDYMKRKQITALPVVDESGLILDIVFRENGTVEQEARKNSLSEIPVVIMAGGKGTRLYPYTKILPKPLIPIGDIPIMERIINNFREYGIQKYLITVNYRKSMIKSYFAELTKDYSIDYIEEDEPLGTAGSLKLISDPFAKPFIVTNCDILIQADYSDIYNYHLTSGNELTIVTALKNIVVPYGVVHSSENGMIEMMEEKPKLSYFVNTGMYILNPELIKDIPEKTFYHMTNLVDRLLADHRKVGMYPISEDSFLDMGEFEEMRRMEAKINLKSKSQG